MLLCNSNHQWISILIFLVTLNLFNERCSAFYVYTKQLLATRSSYGAATQTGMSNDGNTNILVDQQKSDVKKKDPATEKALLGMGCFWAPQEEFLKVYGIESATTGYARATVSTLDNNKEENDDSQRSMRKNPASYLSVCNGDGRTEAVLVEYNPDVLSYENVLSLFWQEHDASAVYPTQEKRDQYRSVIWPLNEEQQSLALQDVQKAVQAYKDAGMPARPRTVIADLPDGDVEDWIGREFKPAESVHQNFWSKLKLKIGAIAAANLFAESSLSEINDIISRSMLQIITVWLLFEILELGASAAGSLGMSNAFSQNRDAS